MSQSPRAAGLGRTHSTLAADVTCIESEQRIQDLLDLLDDGGCRAILAAASEEALSAVEVRETCDIPRSTTYRKLELLTDAGLLEERIRLRRSGKHTSEYIRVVEDVVVSVGTDEGVELQVSRRDADDERAIAARLAGD